MMMMMMVRRRRRRRKRRAAMNLNDPMLGGYQKQDQTPHGRLE
jgi:hypothetical protein